MANVREYICVYFTEFYSEYIDVIVKLAAQKFDLENKYLSLVKKNLVHSISNVSIYTGVFSIHMKTNENGEKEQEQLHAAGEANLTGTSAAIAFFINA